MESLPANGAKGRRRAAPGYRFFEADIVPPALHERFRRCAKGFCFRNRVTQRVQAFTDRRVAGKDLGILFSVLQAGDWRAVTMTT
jgi:hypothetical protein